MSLVTVVGTGYTGARILQRLPPEKADGISRSTPHDVESHRITLADFDGTPPALEAPGSVIYTIAPPQEDTDHRLERFLSALAAPPERFVYLSTTGVYGDRGGAVVLETDTPAPQTARAKRRLNAELRLSSWASENAVSLVILRVPGIYGPDRLGLDRVREAAPMIRESEASPGNRIHVDDLVSCCIAAAARRTPDGIYNLGDGDSRSSTWFSAEVARQIGAKPAPQVSRAEAERSFSERRLSFLSESRSVDTSKMREVLGVIPRYANAEEGIRASLADQQRA